MTHKTKTPLALAIGTAFAASLAASNIANAAPNSSNPFAMSELNSGYMQVADMKEGKCGEGKCGGAKKESMEGKCGGAKKESMEGKCGEGKCGGAKKESMEGKCGEGKCGGKK
ncbi:MAG: hypothetical protein OEU74_06510 [Gammaproteobacteria bacterium]|nr:hypothetical protein [Gammaproteobacteria bacterium]